MPEATGINLPLLSKARVEPENVADVMICPSPAGSRKAPACAHETSAPVDILAESKPAKIRFKNTNDVPNTKHRDAILIQVFAKSLCFMMPKYRMAIFAPERRKGGIDAALDRLDLLPILFIGYYWFD